MVGWFRRNWIPTVGMIVAVGFVAWLGWINVRGGGGSAGEQARGTPSASVGVASPSATAVASATADPAEAAVEAAVKGWLSAYYNSYRTGDASALNSLVVPGSVAAGNAGTPRETVLHSHQTLLVTQLIYATVQVDVTGSSAAADVNYTTIGDPASWPSLQVTGPMQTKHWSAHIELLLIDGRWLINVA
jgi:hypothetical protein